jgi:TP901 family phage tail tape measure protein
MSLKIDKVQLEIIMKSDTARAEIIKLEDESKSLTKELAKVKKQFGENSLEYKDAQVKLDAVKLRMKDLKNEIGLAGMTMKELGQRSKELSLQMRNIDPRTPKYKEFRDELDQVNKRMKELRGTAEGSKMSLGKVADGFNKYFGMATAGIAAFTGLTLAINKFRDARLELEDSKANLKALTGLGDSDITWLTEQAKVLSTEVTKTGVRVRGSSKEIVDAFTLVGSAKPELLKNKEALKEVTEQALILATASKMEVGDAVRGLTIGLNMYGASASEAARYTNVLGAGAKEGAAEVTSQTQSILKAGVAASQANIPIEQLVGSIQALAEKGIKDEIAGTGLKTFFIKLQSGADDTNPKIVGLQKAIENLAAKNLSSAEIQKRFGLETYTVAAAMIASAEKVDFYTKAVTGTNVALEQAQINSQTTAAMLAQAKNKFSEAGMEVVGHLNPALLKATNLSTQFLKVLLELPRIFKENKGLLLTLAITMGAYAIAVERARIATFAQMVLEKAKVVWTTASTAATLLQVAVTGYLTGATRAANLATKAFFSTLMINPYIALGVGIAAVTIGLYKWITANNSVSKAVQSSLNIQTKVNEQYDEQKAKINSLLTVINSELFSMEERRKALDELKKIVPAYHADLTKEGRLINNNKTAIDEYLVSLEKEIRLQASKDELIELNKQKIAKQKEVRLAKEKAAEIEANIKGNPNMAISGGVMLASQGGIINKLSKELDGIDAAIKTVGADYAKLSQTIITTPPAHKDGDLNADGTMEWKGGKWVPLNGGGGNDDKKPYETALAKKEDAYKESQLELMEQRRKGELSEEIYNKIALQTQLSFLEEKKKLQKKFKKDTTDTEIEISNQLSKIGKDADSAALQAIKDNQDAGLSVLENGATTKQEMLQEALNRGVITEKEYNLEVKKLAVELNDAKLALAEAGLEALKKVDFKDKETQKKALEDALAEITKLKAALVKAQGDVAKDVAKGVEKNAETVAERMRKIFGNSFSDIGTMFGTFITGLEKLKGKDLKTWTDWGTAIGDIVQSALAVAVQINDQYFQYKAASLEADKQRELTNAGDSAEEREKINQKYAQKELDLKKKQSSADTVLKVAQAVAAGGLAIVQAFAQLGPIGGAIAAVLIGGITGLQVGTILKQNSAIQATTLDSSTSGGSLSTAATSGARVVTPQAADGRYDVIGAQDGKTYKNVRYAGIASTGLVTRPTLMGEAGTELVIDAPTLSRINMRAPWFNNFVHSNRVNQRADGNYAAIDGQGGSADNSAIMGLLVSTIDRNSALLQYLAENKIEAYTVLADFEKKRDLRDKSLAKGSLK